MKQQDLSEKDAFPALSIRPDVRAEESCAAFPYGGADSTPAYDRDKDPGADLAAAVVRQLDDYFAHLEGREPHPLYDLVVHAVERPLIEYAMSMSRNNQCAAAQLLGINRNTLRKKLQEHGLLPSQRTSKKF